MASAFVTFARWNVFDGEDFIAVRPVRTEDGFFGKTRTGSLIPLSLDDRVITASDAGTIGFNGPKRNAYRIDEKFVRKSESLRELLVRNPFGNVNATIMLREMKKIARAK